MKSFHLDIEHIADTYIKEIRSILELAVPVWHSGLTIKHSRDIERIQKVALYIILGENFINYDVACSLSFFLTVDYRGGAQQMVLRHPPCLISLLRKALYHFLMYRYKYK